MLRRQAVRVFLLGLVVTELLAGCGGTASPAPSPTPTAEPSPTASPSPTPSPSPTATPAPTPKVDPTADLKITAPYSLVALDPVQVAMVEAGIEQGLGAMGSIVQIGVRQVMRGTAFAGWALVIAFPGLAAVNEATFLDTFVNGSARSVQGAITKVTILGRPVRLLQRQGQFQAWATHGQGVMGVGGVSEQEASAIVTALIKANP